MLKRSIILLSRLMNTLYVLTSKDKPKVVDYGSSAYSFKGYNVVINRPKSLYEYLLELFSDIFAFLYTNLISPLLSVNEELGHMIMETYDLFTKGLYIQSPIKPLGFPCSRKEIFNFMLELPCVKMIIDEEGLINLEYLHNVSSHNGYESQGVIIDCKRRLIKRHDTKEFSDDDFDLRIGLIAINTHINLIHLRDYHFSLCAVSAIILNNVKSDNVARLLSPFMSGCFAVPNFSTKVLTANNGVLAHIFNNFNAQEINDFITNFFTSYIFDDAFNDFMKTDETRDYYELCKKFVQAFPENGIDFDGVRKTLVNKGYLKNDRFTGYEIIGYILAAQTLGHNLMTSYFALLDYHVVSLTVKDEMFLTAYKYEVSRSTAFRATRITSKITDNFDYLFTDQNDKHIFNTFQKEVELFLFKMKLKSLPSHTNIQRCAYG